MYHFGLLLAMQHQQTCALCLSPRTSCPPSSNGEMDAAVQRTTTWLPRRTSPSSSSAPQPPGQLQLLHTLCGCLNSDNPRKPIMHRRRVAWQSRQQSGLLFGVQSCLRVLPCFSPCCGICTCKLMHHPAHDGSPLEPRQRWLDGQLASAKGLCTPRINLTLGSQINTAAGQDQVKIGVGQSFSVFFAPRPQILHSI